MYLRGLAEGTRIAAHAISEPSAGSDVFAMSTTAEPRGDGFQLNGIKCFATNAPVADLFLIYAVTAKGRGFFGVSAFLVPRESRGLHVGAPHDKIGLRTSPMADIYLEDCVVPRSGLLGELGGGGAVFMHSMNWERASLFALYVGAMQRQLGLSVEYARARRQFGEPISHFQAVSHRVVDMKIRLETARLLLYRAAWALENDPSDNLSPAMAKLYVSESALRSALDAVHLHGGVGVMEGDVERMLRDVIPAQLFSGTSDIQRNNIARELRL
jgi:alkylation response protein AidB-like acyl-CoA dehydrogenase